MAVVMRNVSVKCTADMQRVLSEELSYSAPDTQNNSGYISRQTLSVEGNGQQAGAAGIPGAQSNTNVTQYNVGQGALPISIAIIQIQHTNWIRKGSGTE